MRACDLKQLFFTRTLEATVFYIYREMRIANTTYIGNYLYNLNDPRTTDSLE